MTQKLDRDEPVWVDRVAAKILRAGYDGQSLYATFEDALRRLVMTDELGLSRKAAGYLFSRDGTAQKLACRIDWAQETLPQVLPASGGTGCEMQIHRDELHYTLPVTAADGRTIGTVFLAAPTSNRLDRECLRILERLLGDVGLLMESKSSETINAQLADIAGASPNEIYLIDACNLHIFQANNAAQSKTGLRPRKILGQSPAELRVGMNEAEYRGLVTPLIEGKKESVVFNARQKRRDGQWADVSVKVWKLESDEGLILVELVQEITESKKLLGILQEAIDGFPGGICVYDEDLRLTLANDKLYEIMDIPKTLFPIGAYFGDIMRYNALRGEYGMGDIDQMVRERVDRVSMTVEDLFERERPDGSTLEIRSSPLPGGGRVLTYTDVTLRRRAERDLMRHRDRLEEAVAQRTEEIKHQAAQLEKALEQERHINMLQRQFVTMASHEFRTPLAIIDGAAQRLHRRKSGLDPDYLHEKIEQIRSAVKRMVDLMESILSSGRLSEGKIEIQMADCNLAACIAQCCKRQSEISKKHHIVADVENLPASVLADKTAVEQVISNLLSNAVKYSPSGGEIVVRGWTEGNGDIAVFSVMDHGLGMDADDIPKLFQRYFRARTSTGIAGTGIGLNLVKQIVELHGGVIGVNSEKGKGSTFIVRLPVYEGGQADIEEQAKTLKAAG